MDNNKNKIKKKIKKIKETEIKKKNEIGMLWLKTCSLSEQINPSVGVKSYWSEILI